MSHRRKFLSELVPLGAALLASRDGSGAEPKAAAPHRIDVHSHFAPPGYVEALKPKGVLNPQILDWSPGRHIDEMNKAGVVTSVTSISPPGVWFDDNETARRIARGSNDYAARLAADYKGRFGSFA